jgi:hypothetical protein
MKEDDEEINNMTYKIWKARLKILSTLVFEDSLGN